MTALCCLSQQNDKVALVGVAVMENHAGRAVPGNVEQDRLVKAINQLKPDKKTHVKVEAVPLQSASEGTSQEEAQKQYCQYNLYIRLIELRNAPADLAIGGNQRS